MKLVVEIDEATYKDIKKGKIYSSIRDVPLESVNAIANGTPLPKGHGREDDAISRQAAVNIASGFCHPANIADELAKLPSVTPQEPKTGKWIAQDIHNCHTDFKCSECGYIHSFMHLYGKPTADYTYCPNCGAKMESEEQSLSNSGFPNIWQKHTDSSGNSWHACPTCGHIAYTLSHYCPDCGARLETPS